MKTLTELLELINQAILNNGTKYNQWFIDFSGHVNKIEIRYYQAGWKLSQETETEPDRVRINLDDEGSIQEGYWFVQNRLN
jgi:hypothetical protein